MDGQVAEPLQYCVAGGLQAAIELQFPEQITRPACRQLPKLFLSVQLRFVFTQLKLEALLFSIKVDHAGPERRAIGEQAFYAIQYPSQ